MSFRKEVKYQVSTADMQNLKSNLSGLGMTALFQPRTVNSIYFDSLDKQMFFDSEEGTLPRKKLRVRYYNNNSSTFVRETKFSTIEGRFKTTRPLEKLKNLKDVLKLRWIDQQYGLVKPIIAVQYRRQYFQYRDVRVTFDDRITYAQIKIGDYMQVREPFCVVEIKADQTYGDDLIRTIIQRPDERFSKYCRGIIACSI